MSCFSYRVRNFSRLLNHLIAVTLVMLCATAVSYAQNSNAGDIRGTVTDPTGAVIPGVSVNILNTDTGVARDLITNDAGIYDAVSVLPGRYKLTFTKPGFGNFVRDGVNLTVGAVTIDAQLTVGGTQQEVQVTEEVPQLKTETAEQSTTLESASMQKLPNIGQDWSNFTKILPGGNGSGTGVSVNGNLPFYSNFLADGASTTLPHSANTDVSIFESVSEVQIQTSTFSALYGIGGAVFNQISKSGTNQWHGSAYEYLQNNFFNARDFFSPDVPNQRYHNFGGSVAGPVLKNKLFFYFNVDKVINNAAYYPINTYPTADMRAGNFSNPIFPAIYDPASLNPVTLLRTPFAGNQVPISRIDPLAAKFQNLFPATNLEGYANNNQTPVTYRSPFLRYFGRLDYNLSDKNRLTISVTQRDLPGYNPSPDCPLDCTYGDIESYNAQISDVWTISSNTVNEFRFGFTRQGNYFTPVSLGQGLPQKLGWQYAKADVAPGVNITGAVCCSGIGPGTNAIYVENSFEPSDVVTMIRGKHILHFGGEVLMYQDNSTPWGNVNSGNFTFSGVFTQRAPFDSSDPSSRGASGLGYADFLLGQVDSWNASNTPITGMRQKSPQVFVQDDYKVRPNLTLNLGLRYQIQNGWHEVGNRLGAFDPTIINPATGTLGAMWFAGNNGRTQLEANYHKIILPRVGFAWSPAPNWAIRGGFGIYSYNWSIDTYAANAVGLGTNSQGSLSETNQQQPVFILSNPNPPLNYVGATHAPDGYNGQGVNYYPYHIAVPRNYQWSFSMQRQLPANMVAELAYVGSRTTNLSFPADVNQVPANLLGRSSDPQADRPYPQFLGISGNMYNAISNYDSLQASFNKRFSRGISFDVNYTWSKLLTEQDSGGYGGSAGQQYVQYSYNPRANYALSNLDRPHMFKGDFVWDVPVGKGRTFVNRGGLLDAVIGGWQLSSIFLFESGTPYTPYIGTDNLSGSLANYWYPNVVGNPSVANPNINQWFNPSAFAVPLPFTFGNAGRNILRGPGLIDVDASLGKNFRIPLPRETGNLQLRFDAQNALNHANFANPNAAIGNAGAGIITSTTGLQVNGGNARTLQLGARFSF